MKELSARLQNIIDTAEVKLREVSEEASALPALPGGWSRKQLLGHLIDSASNNHQRFVRALQQPTLEFPAYEQESTLRVQGVAENDWRLLVTLWASYNRYLAHLIGIFPASKLETPCRIGEDDVITLAFMAEDYLRHLVHHLEQIGATEPGRTSANF